jgi:hypothetical protein
MKYNYDLKLPITKLWSYSNYFIFRKATPQAEASTFKFVIQAGGAHGF